MVPNHLDKHAHKYLGMVRQASRKYGVDESLILAIMQTRSSFNPYAGQPFRCAGINAGGTTYCRERCVPLAGNAARRAAVSCLILQQY
ncbi:transglycosylase SLT domain-containing protein [Escherichia coli]